MAFDDATWLKSQLQNNLKTQKGGIAPDRCRNMTAAYDAEAKTVTLRWKDSKDTVLLAQILTSWRKTHIVRKEGGYPEDVNDGTLILTNTVWGAYASEGYTDDVSGVDDIANLYYAAFPESDTGSIAINEKNRFPDANGTEIYTWYKYLSNPVPGNPGGKDGRITYGGDNEEYSPAYMDYDAGVFNYGSWDEAFFVTGVKPCMLKYDGTVGYYLDPGNTAMKEDGVTASDIANADYDGNAMVERPLAYFAYDFITDSNGVTCIRKRISNRQVSDEFKPYWCFVDKNNLTTDRCYFPAYMGTVINSVMRSLSDQTGYANSTFANEITYCNANNTVGNLENQWTGFLASGWLMDCDLLELMGCSTDGQTVFGAGNHTGAVYTTTTGALNAKGLFYGYKTTGDEVKVFGREAPWGKRWNRIWGLVNASGTMKVKLTYGTADGSTGEGYNATGAGYISLDSGFKPAGTSGGYISETAINVDLGVELGCTASGSSSTYECDGLWFNNSQTNIALVGGSANSGLLCGPRALHVNNAASFAGADSGASLFFIPLAS